MACSQKLCDIEFACFGVCQKAGSPKLQCTPPELEGAVGNLD
jgi:hypothetical protein